MSWPRAALFSLSDTAGAAEFARALAAGGTRILASGGTAKHLTDAGVAVTPIERWTGMTPLLGGRVKTLHPHLHAPILARRDRASDLAELAERSLEPIDLVAVTLYPFEARAGSLGEAEAVEEIDIGGVALLRAAAKNYADVIVAHDPARYLEVLAALAAGGPALEERRRWALATFARTARYDAAIAAELERRGGSDELPAFKMIALERVRALRYGENPHQRAALYATPGAARRFTAWQEGRELSYNNLLDLERAVSLVSRLAGPACVIVKHGEPCGAAVAATPAEAYEAAAMSDPLSAFGGVVALNRPLDRATAERMLPQFLECVAAPAVSEGVEAVFMSKRKLRVVRLAAEDVAAPGSEELRWAGAWVLAQRECPGESPVWRTLSARAPSAEEMVGLSFAWQIAAHARSNAIAIARGTRLLGLGSGQTSRVDAVDLGVLKARRAGHSLAGAALASDGFFPFPDGVEHAAAAGITAVVQPGGSKRDAEVVAACDRLGVAMVQTDRRAFRH